MIFEKSWLDMNLENAIQIAVDAHKGQFDKGGQPYILHPLRVMINLRTTEEQIVGVLHDVVEDCSEDGYTFEYLKDQGFSSTVLDALRSVTKTIEEQEIMKNLPSSEKIDSYIKFVSRAKCNPIGKNVKRADILDNLNIIRLGELTSSDIDRLNQYKLAIEFLDS